MFNWLKLSSTYFIYDLCLGYFHFRIQPPIQGNGSGYHLQQPQVTYFVQELDEIIDWHYQPVARPTLALIYLEMNSHYEFLWKFTKNKTPIIVQLIQFVLFLFFLKICFIFIFNNI